MLVVTYGLSVLLTSWFYPKGNSLDELHLILYSLVRI